VGIRAALTGELYDPDPADGLHGDSSVTVSVVWRPSIPSHKFSAEAK